MVQEILDDTLPTFGNKQAVPSTFTPSTAEEDFLPNFTSVNIGGESIYQYDGDTLINKITGERIRITGFDSPEVSKIYDSGVAKFAEKDANSEHRMINDIIKQEGFNTYKDSGEVDKYGRKLGDLVNAQGITLGNYLHGNRLVDPSGWQSSEQEVLRSFSELADTMNSVGKITSPRDKARGIVENSIRGLPYDIMDVFGSPASADSSRRRGINHLQSEANRLSLAAKLEKDPELKKGLEQELTITRNTLQQLLNTQPTSLYTEQDRGVQKTSPGTWGEMWNSGEKSLYMLENTAAGFTQWAGDLINSETIETWGEDWVADTVDDLKNAGYTTDMWSVRNPLDASRFFANTVIQYAPQMAAIWTGTKAGAIAGAPFGPGGAFTGMIAGGLGTGIILAVSSVYQDQPEGEKDPLIALGISLPIAALDLLGVTRALPIGTNLYTKSGKQDVVDTIMSAVKEGEEVGPEITEARRLLKEKGKDLTEENITKIVNDATLKLLKAGGEELSQFAADQLLAKRTFRDLMVELSKRAGIEGATEAMQEVIQDIGIAGTTSKELDYQELLYNALESGTIGAIVGGTFATPGIVSQQVRDNEIFRQIMPENEVDRSRISILEEVMKKDHWKGVKKSNIEVAEFYKQRMRNAKTTFSLRNQARAAKEKTRYTDLLSLIKNPKRAVQAYRNFANDYIWDKDGNVNFNIANLAAHLDGIRLYTGMNVDKDRGRLFSRFTKELPGKVELLEQTGVRNAEELFNLVKSDPALLSDFNKAKVLGVKNLFKTIGQEISKEIEGRGLHETHSKGSSGSKPIDIDLDKLKDGSYFTDNLSIKRDSVDEKFIELLKQTNQYKSGSNFAPLGQLDGFNDIELDKMVSGLRKGYLSSTDRVLLERAGVFDKEVFRPYISRDLFDNVLSNVENLSRDISFSTQFGSNGEVLAQMLHDAQEMGEINPEQKAELAAMTSDYIDMLKGRYRPVKSKKIRWIQDHILFMSTLTYMDMNFFANMVEAVNGLIGLDKKQMFNYMREGSTVFYKGLLNDISNASGVLTRKTTGRPIGSLTPKRRLDNIGIKRLVETGIVGPRADIAKLEGANTSSEFFTSLSSTFYKINLVENQTMALRGGRAAGGWATILQDIAIIKQDRERGYTTQAGRWSRDRLNFYRVDADLIIDIMDRNKQKGITVKEEDLLENKVGSILLEQMDSGKRSTDKDQELVNDANALREQYLTGLAHFVAEMSVIPEAGAQPKVIEDGGMVLFTQFKRFITNFTANIIPRVWNEYIKRGSPGMTYSTFSIIMGAYAMAMLSQMMKDFIVYGEKAPWLEDDEEDPYWLRTSYWRAAEYSGWTGTPSMLVQAIGDYDRNAIRMNVFENLYDSAVNQSPALGLLNREIGKGTKDLPERIAKVTPFVGDNKAAREWLAGILGSEE